MTTTIELLEGIGKKPPKSMMPDGSKELPNDAPEESNSLNPVMPWELGDKESLARARSRWGLSEEPESAEPTTASDIRDSISPEKRRDSLGSHFLSGVDRSTKLLASPFEKIFGTVVLGGEGGVTYLTPEETSAANEAKEIGIPGRATTEPSNIYEAGARFAGDTAVAAPILGTGLGAIAAPAEGATGLLAGGRGLLNAAGQTFVNAPVAGTAIETALGATAGAGGYAAAEAFPDSPMAEFFGEVAGGIAPQVLLPGKILLGGAKYIYNKVKQPFSGAGGQNRAKDRVARSVSPNSSMENINKNLDAPTTIDPKTGKPILTPATRSDELGVLELQKSIMNSTDELRHTGTVRTARANEVLNGLANDIGGDIGDTTQTFESAQATLEQLAKTRIELAAESIEQRVGQLGDATTREQANFITKQEFDKVIVDLKTQSDQLWKAADDFNLQVPTSETVNKLNLYLAEQGKTGFANIPPYARKFFSPTLTRSVAGVKKQIPNPNYLGKTTTINQIRIAQSELSTIAANFRNGAAPNYKKARIAQGMADAIDLDLGNAVGGEEAIEALRLARGFTSKMRDIVDKSVIGKVTRRNTIGGENIDSALALESTIGLAGPKGRVAFDEMLRAFENTETLGNTELVAAASDYFRSRFAIEATEGGIVNKSSAARFLKSHDEVLRRLPDVKSELETIAKDGGNLLDMQKQLKLTKFDDPKISKAAMFIQKGPVETFNSIARMQPKDANKAIGELIEKASLDDTGKALEGLKAGFIEHILTGSTGQKRDMTGKLIPSGFAITEMLSNPAMKRVLTDLLRGDELNRLKIIANDYTRMEKAASASGSIEGVLGDKPARILNGLAGFVGAAAAKAGAAALGHPGTLQAPSSGSAGFKALLAAGVADPARRLLIDGILDDDIFRGVLMEPIVDGKISKAATRKLNAWFATVLAERGGMLEDDENK